MPKIALSNNPSLTKEKLLSALQSHFSTKGYEVGYSSLIGADIYVRKNGWVGAAIKLKQKDKSTFIRASGYAPSVAVRLLLYGVITYLILLPKWNALIKEIREYAESSKELNGTA